MTIITPKPPREIVSIVEIAVYVPLSLIAILLIIRHGIRSTTSWLFVSLPILVLSGIRLAGAALEIKGDNTQNAATAQQSVILDSVGLAPLTLLMIGMLSRAQAPLDLRIPGFLLLALDLLSLGATAIAVIGGKDVFGSDPSQTALGHTLMRAGVIIFLGLALAVEILAGVTLPRVRRFRPERVVVVTMFAIAPFWAVRLAYSVVTAFTTLTPTSLFNPEATADNAVWAHFGMVIVMEMMVVILAELSSLASSQSRGKGGDYYRESRGPGGY